MNNEAQVSEYTGRKLIALTGKKVHYPVTQDQQDAGRTQCTPFGRMGARQMRLRFTTDSRFPVNCERCLKGGAPT